MKSVLYVLLAMLASVGIGKTHQNELKNQPSGIDTKNLGFKPAPNVSIGPKTIIAAYGIAGIDFTLNHHEGFICIGSDEGQKVMEAEVFRLDGETWVADLDFGQYVTINARTGETESYIDDQFRRYERECEP
ncbi:MAG: hypothetical protein KDC70_00040 [Saprospiraceae bacterium]|nr:hypothetical protein [Saprospiraceae bacterium]